MAPKERESFAGHLEQEGHMNGAIWEEHFFLGLALLGSHDRPEPRL